MLVVHPTFMVTRGKRWARTFLRHLNHVAILALGSVVLLSLLPHQPAHTGLSIFGLVLAVVVFGIYRSRAFDNACKHFEEIWDEYRERRSSR